MMRYLLILLIVLLNVGGIAFNRKFARDTQHISHSYEVYSFLTFPLAAIYYLILSGGSVPLNLPTFLFSAVFAVVCLLSNFFNIEAYRFSSILYITVFNGAGVTILPFLFELLVLQERFSAFQISSVILRLIAVVIPLLLSKDKNSNTKKGLLVCCILFIVAGAASIVTKLYGMHPDVYSDGSFCFWTNLFIMPIVLVYVLKKANFKTIWQQSKKIPKIDYLVLFLAMALTNLCTFFSIEAIRQISATLYSVLTSSLEVIVFMLLSVFVYKEKLDKTIVLSVIFSFLAIIIGVL